MNRRFQFHKRRQPFIRAHDETFSIPLRTNNENVSLNILFKHKDDRFRTGAQGSAVGRPNA